MPRVLPNRYSDHAQRLVHRNRPLAEALADIARIAILQYRATLESHELMDQLTTALNTRVEIEQTKGIVAEQSKLDMEHAFAALRSHARHNSFRLADVATAMVNGTLNSASLRSAAGSRPDRPKSR